MELKTKTLNTWEDNPNYTFEYIGTVKSGITLFAGSIKKAMIFDRMTLRNLLSRFAGKSIPLGAIHSNERERGSLGEWFWVNGWNTNPCSYISAILIKEGYAVKDELNSKNIKFV